MDFASPEEPQYYRISYLAGEGYRNYLANLNNLDADVWRQAATTVKEYAPHVVGISSKSQNFASAVRLARIVKAINKDTVVVIGGPHPSMAWPEVMKVPEIDFCVLGEGEVTLVELLNALKTGRDPADIPGLALRRNSLVERTSARELIHDLDSLPFPHASAPTTLVDYALYPPHAYQYIFATRGCPHACFYCGSRNVWSRRTRLRSIENVVAELQALRGMGLRSFLFDDDNFGINKSHLKRLCASIGENCPGITWTCEIHADLVDIDTATAMRKGGCNAVAVGIESGNDGVLRAIRKGVTVSKALEACSLLKAQGIEVRAFFIIGFPFDTEDTIADTFKAMQSPHIDKIIYSVFTPYPGTEAYDYCRDKGLIPPDFDVSLYNHQSPANHFCENIPPERFRELASRIEAFVDEKNEQ
ncbi:MAG: radical SAM protein [Desulfovibrio sp.]|nr:radical SAM protein [Desulfovibrio sp.]MBI4959119.1 radical SAM protein [Desulfovibrio sp.]